VFQCYVYLITFAWNAGKWSVQRDTHKGHIMCIQQSRSEGKNQLLDPSVSRKMLGVYMSPDAKETKQKRILMKNATLCGKWIKIGYINNKQDVHMA